MKDPRRGPMFWLVWGLPAAAVVAGFITLWIALRDPDPMVRDDLRKDGLTYETPATPARPPP